MANAHYGSLYISQIVYANSVGFGVAYPRMMGNARAFMCGMSNSSDTRAFFSVCFEVKQANSKWIWRFGCERWKKKFTLKSTRYE